MAHGVLKPRAKHLNQMLVAKAGASGMHGPKTNKQRRAQEKRVIVRFINNEMRAG